MLVKLEGVYHVLLQSSSHSLCDDPDQALPVMCSVLLDY